MKVVDMVKEAMTGLVGDNVRTIPRAVLEDRVTDVADRYGEYPPAIPMFVEAVREAGGRFMGPVGDATVVLPRRPKLFDGDAPDPDDCRCCGAQLGGCDLLPDIEDGLCFECRDDQRDGSLEAEAADYVFGDADGPLY